MSSVEATLESAFTTLLAKARQEERELPTRPATINFGFGGGGQAIQVDPILLTPIGMDPQLVDIPFPCRVVWARMRALDASGRPALVDEASIDVQLSQFGTFGSSLPLFGTGFMPQILEDTKADLDTSDWQSNLTTGDSLIATLHSFSGLAAVVSLTLLLRPTEVPIGVAVVVDNGGVPLTGPDDQQLVVRD